jgi:hypothetical protein
MIVIDDVPFPVHKESVVITKAIILVFSHKLFDCLLVHFEFFVEAALYYVGGCVFLDVAINKGSVCLPFHIDWNY